MAAPSPPTLALVTDSGFDGDLITNTAAITALVGVGTTPTFAIETSNPDDRVWLTLEELNDLLANRPDGEVTVVARQANAGGEISALASLTFIVDRTPPIAPAVTPTNIGSELVVLSEPGSVALYSYRLVGTSEFSPPVQVAPSGLPPGTYEIRVVAMDLAGNESDDRIVEITVIPPPTVTLNDTGISDSDAITRISMLEVAVDDGNTAEFSYDNGGTWETDQRASLADGTYSMLVRQVNPNGVKSEAIEVTFALDTIIADLVLPSTFDLDAWLELANGPALEGLEDGALVEFSTDDGTTWVTEHPIVDVSDGNVIQVRQTDLAGNVSNPTTVTIETTNDTILSAAGDGGLTFDVYWSNAPGSGLF